MSFNIQPHDPAEYGGGGSSGANYYDPTADFSQAISHANDNRRTEGHSQHGGGNDEEESSLFSKAIGFISEHKDSLKNQDVDEDMAVGAHQDLYSEGGSTKSHNADSLGGGAAVQALKMFMGEGQGHGGHGGGKNDQNKLIGIAMAQAGKLWEQQNKQGKATSDKQSAVNSAAKQALQMYLKGNHGASGTGGLGGLASKLASGGGHGHGGGHGGASDLFNVAKKFM